MKIKLGELSEMRKSLNLLLGERLPVKTAYRFSKLSKKVFRELQDFEENRMILVDRYAKKDEAGNFIIEKNTYCFESDRRQEFDNEFRELCDEEVDISFEPVPIDALGDISISPADIAMLDKFIKD